MRLGISQLGLSQWRAGGGGAPAPSLPILDTVTGAGAAYSTRKLRTAYAGSAIRVRRSSDNTEQDIGFDSSGDLDTAALTSFVGANSAFVVTWYDQTTNARHISQATAAAQPRIVNAGTIDVRNGVPTVVFDGVDDHLFNTSPWLYANTVMTAHIVAAMATPTARRTILSEAPSTSSAAFYLFSTGNGGGSYDNLAAYIRNDLGSDLISVNGPLNMLDGAFDDTLKAYVWRDTGSAFDGFANNTQGTTINYTRSGTFTVDRFCIGGLLRATISTTSIANMALSEAIFFAVAQSTTDRVAVNTDQGEAYGITLNF